MGAFNNSSFLYLQAPAEPKDDQTQLAGEENIKKKTVKKGTSKSSTAEKVTKKPKLTAAVSVKSKDVAGAKKVVEKKSEKGLTAADVKNNNTTTVKSAPKRKNIAASKLVRRSLIILNAAAAQAKMKPTKDKAVLSDSNSDEIASTEDEVYPAAPAKVKTTSKKGTKGVK